MMKVLNLALSYVEGRVEEWVRIKDLSLFKINL